MNTIYLHIISIALATSIACCLPGIFLVLRGVALMSDAISHAILPGIVLMFLVTHNLDSPWLIMGASLAGMATVLLTEWIIHTRKLKKDAAIGLVFPLFFSIGIILINLFTRNAHLDMDMVLLGELAFTPFNRLIIAGIDCGPSALYIMGFVACLNALLVFLFYKELHITTFDPALASMIGISPLIMYYGLMLVTSITAVAAFNVVGSIVVVALMLAPAGTAYLLTNQLKTMIPTALLCATTSTLLGYLCAHVADISIAGAIATMSGLLFFAVYGLAHRFA
ncbi:MAG: metal ABC transporter permease [Candidatus Babeliales bacterium]